MRSNDSLAKIYLAHECASPSLLMQGPFMPSVELGQKRAILMLTKASRVH